jgi:glucokinase
MRSAGSVGALDIGGTHVTSALVSMARRAVEPGTLERRQLAPDGARDELLGTIVGAARRLSRLHVARWGIATPGPFDYERGVSLIRGVAKLDGLYDVDLGAVLGAALGLERPALSFINDANAFLIGEWWAGAAQGTGRAMGVTLGTGLGSAFLSAGRIVEDDEDVPPQGRLDLVPYRGAPVEDTLSRRGIRAAYGADGPDVDEIARRARSGERRASDVLRRFGSALGDFLARWVVLFAPETVVLGGSIARSWDLWSEDFRAACSPEMDLTWYGVAAHLDEAPLLGAAYHAARS